MTVSETPDEARSDDHVDVGGQQAVDGRVGDVLLRVTGVALDVRDGLSSTPPPR
jgi:hypothetical protein